MIDDSSGDDIVVSYNHALLELKCKTSSLEYDASLDRDLIVKELFRPDEWWQSRDLLLHSLNLVGGAFGFFPAIDKNEIKCNREGSKEYKRSYAGGGLKV